MGSSGLRGSGECDSPNHVHEHGAISLQKLLVLLHHVVHVRRVLSHEVWQSFHQSRGRRHQRQELQQLYSRFERGMDGGVHTVRKENRWREELGGGSCRKASAIGL